MVEAPHKDLTQTGGELEQDDVRGAGRKRRRRSFTDEFNTGAMRLVLEEGKTLAAQRAISGSPSQRFEIRWSAVPLRARQSRRATTADKLTQARWWLTAS